MEKVALVTGAGRSVGLGIAEALAADGFAVAINDLHPDRAASGASRIAEAGGKALALPFDVTDRAAIFAAVADLASQWGPVDVLVNNAGIPERNPRARFIDYDPSDWAPQFDLNLFGSMHCIQAVAPSMVERGWGRIIQISSGAAATGLDIGQSLYAAAKAGVEGLLRHIATELGGTGVTANALSLGLMENTGVAGMSPLIERLLRGVPVRRLGKASEIGAAVCWLASEPGGFVTGSVIHVNGGSLNGR